MVTCVCQCTCLGFIEILGTTSAITLYIIVESFSIVLVSLCSVTLCVTSLQVQNILKYLFPVPKEDSKRVVTFANQEDYISFR